MTNLSRMNEHELKAFHHQIRERYAVFKQRGMTLNLTRGKPSSKQLDLSVDLLALPGVRDYTAADKTDCRNYGGLQGLMELRTLLAPVYGVTAERVILGNNSSLAFMHDSIVFALVKGVCDSAVPWSKEKRVAFLCPVPGYDRHFAICEEFGIDMISVPMTDAGPDMNVVERLVASDAGIKGMWCVPKYSNPTGTVYSADTVERLAKMKTAAPDFRLFWDNAYAIHHLTAERIEIANVVEACERHAHANRPFVYGSTSKVTLAGAGVALFASSKDNVAWYLKRIEKRTIGGDKVNQLRHARFLRDPEGLAKLMDRHREILTPKFNKVVEVFTEILGSSSVASWTVPRGGYFISLDVPEGCAKQVVKLAQEAGVELTSAGATHPYGKDPQDRTIRIAPSFPELAEVAAAAEGVALCVLLVASEMLLKKRAA